MLTDVRFAFRMLVETPGCVAIARVSAGLLLRLQFFREHRQHADVVAFGRGLGDQR